MDNHSVRLVTPLAAYPPFLAGATQSHAVLTRTTPRSDSFTQILVVVVTVFVICVVPSFILRLFVTARHFMGVSGGGLAYREAIW